MPRRVIIRSRQLDTVVAQLEVMIAAQWKEIFKQHIDDLEAAAEWITADAQELVPLLTGKLQNSINVRVSKSNRYPGLIATASAKSKKGFDYALIQEENEEFSHEGVRQAHYLSEPFYNIIDEFFFEWTGKHLQRPHIPEREDEE